MTDIGGLRLQSEIERRMGDLIESAERLITDRGDNIKHIESASTQIRNAMSVANDAPHIAVVTSFIRYQIGRAGTPNKVWKVTGLGEAVIKEIEGRVHSLAQGAVSASDFGSVDEVQVQLTRLLLGFMYRRYVYEADKLQKGGNT